VENLIYLSTFADVIGIGKKWITRLTGGKKAWVMENRLCFHCFQTNGQRGSEIW
jgi:hypothetical protein